MCNFNMQSFIVILVVATMVSNVFNALMLFTIFLIIVCALFLMIFSLRKSEAAFLDVTKSKNPIIVSKRFESPVMKIDSEVKAIPTFEVKNKLKRKMFDLPEIKTLNDIFAKLPKVKPITFAKKLAKPSISKPTFNLFAKTKPKLIDLSGTSKKLGPKKPQATVINDVINDETCGCGTDMPTCQNEIHLNRNQRIPELREFESNLLNHLGDNDEDNENAGGASTGDDNFILVDDENFSKDESNANLRKLNTFLSKITKFPFKSGTTKRDVSYANKLNAEDKTESETSAEKSRRINDSLQKLMQFVTIVGQVDTFITKKARDTIRKLSHIVDDDDYDYRRRNY